MCAHHKPASHDRSSLLAQLPLRYYARASKQAPPRCGDETPERFVPSTACHHRPRGTEAPTYLPTYLQLHARRTIAMHVTWHVTRDFCTM